MDKTKERAKELGEGNLAIACDVAAEEQVRHMTDTLWGSSVGSTWWWLTTLDASPKTVVDSF